MELSKSNSMKKIKFASILFLMMIGCAITSCSSKLEPSQELYSFLEEAKSQLPINLDVVTTLRNVFFEGDFFVYEYDMNVDESAFDENALNLKTSLKKNLEYQSTNGDEKFKMFYSHIIAEGFGLSYRYNLKSGVVKNIDFGHDMLP